MSSLSVAILILLFALICVGVGFSIAKAMYEDMMEFQEDLIQKYRSALGHLRDKYEK